MSKKTEMFKEEMAALLYKYKVQIVFELPGEGLSNTPYFWFIGNSEFKDYTLLDRVDFQVFGQYLDSGDFE